MFKSLLQSAKEQAKSGLQAVKQNVEQTGKSYAQKQRDNLIKQANHSNMKKRYYGRKRK